MSLGPVRDRSGSAPLLFPIICMALGLGFVGALAMVSIYAAAVPYALGLLALVYFRPDLAIGFILASAPYCYDLGLGPVNIALSDISLVVALPVLLIKAKDPFGRFLRNPLLPAAIAYLVVCVFSILANGSARDAVTSMVQMGLYLIVTLFVFSSCIDDPKVMVSGMYGMLSSCSFLAAVKLSTNSLYILGLHKNSIGSSLSYGTLVAVELWISSSRKSRPIFAVALALILAGLVSTLSRGAWVGSLGGIMLILLLRKQFVLGVRLAVLALPIMAICWMLLPEQAKESATTIGTGKFTSFNARLESIDYAYAIFSSSPMLGGGVGIRKQYDATNLVMSTLAETGIAGITTFASIYLVFGWAVWRARNRISLASPLLPLVTIGAALVLCELLHGMVDHFWSRGCLPAWAGMGMAMCAYRMSARSRKGVRP